MRFNSLINSNNILLRKCTAFILAILMVTLMFPYSVIADSEQMKDITVYVTMSRNGNIVSDKNEKPCAELPVILSGKASYSLDDVLTAFHKDHYENGTGGYSTVNTEYGENISKLWGDTSGNFGYQLNAGKVSVWGPGDPVSDGDYLDLFINESTYPDNEAYTAFSAYSETAVEGESVDLTLYEGGYDEFFSLVMSPCSNATITVDGESTTVKTDKNGKASVVFNSVGTHVVSAVKTKTVGEEEVTAITAPVCVVEVKKAFLSDLILRTGSKTANVLPAFDSKVRNYECEIKQTISTLYLTATLSDDAPEGSIITAEYLKVDNSLQTMALTSGTQKTMALGNKMGNRTTLIRVTVGTEGNTQEYIVKVNPIKEGYLSVLSMSTTDGGSNLISGFDSDIYSYSIFVTPGTDKLYFVSAPYSKVAPDASVSVGETVLEKTGVNAMLNNAGKYEAKTEVTIPVSSDGSSVTCLTLSKPVTTESIFVTVIANKTAASTTSKKYVIRINPAPAHSTPEEAFGGTGTETDPYLIGTSSQLTEFALMVNGGINFEGKTVKLTNNVTLSSDWIPIGCITNCTMTVKDGLNAFKGTFDGDGHTVNVPKGGLPLFGYVENTTIKNIKIYGEKINGYGLVNNFEGVSLTSVTTIDNVTLLSGTEILKSGLIGGNVTTNGWAANSPTSVVNISNCTVEKGVVIGYDGKENDIGSIAGRLQGTITNCKSYATVKGVNNVGGIVGTRDNALGEVSVSDCYFGGTVTGTEFVGGIAGGGYNLANDAPNGGKISLINNTVSGTVTGTSNVGGILGGDPYVIQVWDNVICKVQNNKFEGKVSGETNVGGIIGSYLSLDCYDLISGNTYTEGCGSEKGIASVYCVDTNASSITSKFDETTNNVTIDGVLYYNTEPMDKDNKTGLPTTAPVKQITWRYQHNRTDDPLGADIEKLFKKVSATTVLLGDVDKSGEVDSLDALYIYMYYGNPLSVEGLDLDFAAGDVDKSGTVDSYDALLVYMYYSGAIADYTLN